MNHSMEVAQPDSIPTPVYRERTKDMTGGWRRNTPPIVESLDETYEEIIDKQGRSDNRGPS